MNRISVLKKELETAASIRDRKRRALSISSVLEKALSKYDLHPILVGGAAVEIYTNGLYTSGDLDYVLPHSSELKQVMCELGFEKEGRLFIHPKLQLIVEFPSSSLGKDESYEKIDFEGISVRIISKEDLLIDRLNSFKWGGSSADAQNVLFMLAGGLKVTQYVRKRASAEDVLDALNGLVRIKMTIERDKLNQNESELLLKSLILKFKRK